MPVRPEDVKFDYKTLERNNGEKVGVFRDWNVIATTKKAYFNRENTQGAYLIYDDGNKLVFNGKVCGTIGIDGKVNYGRAEYRYVSPQEPTSEVKQKPQVIDLPTPGEIKLGDRVLADDIIDSIFKINLEQMLEG